VTHRINVPLARLILAQLLAAPRRWRQGLWLSRPYPRELQGPTNTIHNCETSGCFAGWAVVLGGYKTNSIGSILTDDLTPPTRDRIAAVYGEHNRPEPGEYASTQEVATVALGLTRDQATELFAAENTLRNLYGLLELWTEGEITTPDDLPEWADWPPSYLEGYWQDNPEPDDQESAGCDCAECRGDEPDDTCHCGHPDCGAC
jgi:hypothetical protein